MRHDTAKGRFPNFSRQTCTLVLSACGAALLITGCQPTVRVEAPKEPITINLNVNLTAEVRVKLEEQAQQDIAHNKEIF